MRRGSPSPRRALPRPRAWLRRALREQPALVLTGGYLLLTSIGIGYQYAFFLQFRVNILDYAEISDFLLAPIRQPAVILLALLPVVFTWLLHLVGQWLRGISAWYAALANRTDTPTTRAVLYPIAVAIYFLWFALIYAERVARPIKEGEGKRVVVELAVDQEGSAVSEALFLGKTSAFVFVYYPVEGRAHILPIENIARIVVVPLVRQPRR